MNGGLALVGLLLAISGSGQGGYSRGYDLAPGWPVPPLGQADLPSQVTRGPVNFGVSGLAVNLTCLMQTSGGGFRPWLSAHGWLLAGLN